jgi:hypothetical protein
MAIFQKKFIESLPQLDAKWSGMGICYSAEEAFESRICMVSDAPSRAIALD